ncbi:cupin domain-containing protein [Thalassoroseus pseudoceratinae]|uniref:cupin domain-containing protein n=1 Tax=Thalassoroseus pseudoceratinae TaxID=2713176 RepID=UPI0014201898|nr:cupin domain-containing protein [Thalassoroseus pseudoceratinae]
MDNLFADLPTDLPEELITVLAANQHVRIERIVSTGHKTADDSWYDQQETEWVVVLKGEATLVYADGESQQLTPGDWVLIPAHRKHRVDWTSPEEPTVWLAVFFQPESEND